MDFVLADNLSKLLIRSGMDIGALAHRARIERQDLEQFLAGTAWPCPRQQGRLALALGVTTADLHREPE